MNLLCGVYFKCSLFGGCFDLLVLLLFNDGDECLSMVFVVLLVKNLYLFMLLIL